MDTTLQLIVATLSGFIIAFLAEPAKMFFEGRKQRSDLRHALYAELLTNYDLLVRLFGRRHPDVSASRPGQSIAKLMALGIRTECYRHAISEATMLFYQLAEAPTISTLHEVLNSLLDWARPDKEVGDRAAAKGIAYAYLSMLEDFIVEERLDEGLLTKIGPQSMKALLKNAQESVGA